MAGIYVTCAIFPTDSTNAVWRKAEKVRAEMLPDALRNMMDGLHLTLENAMDVLHVAEELRPGIRKATARREAIQRVLATPRGLRMPGLMRS